MSERLSQTPVPLKTGNTPAWQLWAQLAQFARHLQPTDWVLVGGQMVALHCRPRQRSVPRNNDSTSPAPRSTPSTQRTRRRR